MNEHRCSCAFCMGFEPWRSDYAGCIQRRWAVVSEAIHNGSACEIAWIDDVAVRVVP
jgi:hypothetical protein